MSTIKKTLSDKGKDYVANWVTNNEHTLTPIPISNHYNYFSSGKKSNAWKRVGQGKKNDRKFRIFNKDGGVQDLDRVKKPNTWKLYHMPNQYVIVWYENEEAVDIEWMNYDDAKKLDPKVEICSSYF